MSRRRSSVSRRGSAQSAPGAALSPRALLGFALADVTRLLRSIYDARLSAEGLSGASWRVLAYLYREDGLTQTKLAEMLEVSRPAVGQMIDRLEAAGFVERRSDPSDRRSWRVFLSSKSQARLAKYLMVARATEEECFGVLSQSELTQLAALVEKLRERLSRLPSEPGDRGEGA